MCVVCDFHNGGGWEGLPQCGFRSNTSFLQTDDILNPTTIPTLFLFLVSCTKSPLFPWSITGSFLKMVINEQFAIANIQNEDVLINGLHQWALDWLVWIANANAKNYCLCS